MMTPMLRRMIDAPVALAHYAVGSVYVLVQLASYERNVRRLHESAHAAQAH